MTTPYQILQYLLSNLTDLTLDMSAVSLSSHVGEKGVSGGASVAAGGVDDIRQPSVDGLHSPSSPNAPIAVAKQGMYVCITTCHKGSILLYLKVTIICRYIFLRFWPKTCFAGTKFCDLYVEMVQGRQILMF